MYVSVYTTLYRHRSPKKVKDKELREKGKKRRKLAIEDGLTFSFLSPTNYLDVRIIGSDFYVYIYHYIFFYPQGKYKRLALWFSNLSDCRILKREKRISFVPEKIFKNINSTNNQESKQTKERKKKERKIY